MPPGDVLLIITRPEIPLAPYRGWPGRYPRHMTDQGRGRSPAGRGPRHAMGTASGPQPSLGPGSGAQQVLESDSGPQYALPPGGPGTGPQQVLGPGGPGSGPQQVLGPTGPLRSLYPADPASATGAMGAMGPTGPTGPLPKTPVRGFPPGRRPGPWADGDTVTSPVPSLSEPQTPFVEDDDDLYVLGDGYPSDDVLFPQGGGYLEGPTPDDLRPAPSSRAGRRGRRKERGRRSRVALVAVSVLVLGGAALASYKYLYEPRVNAPVSPSLRLPTTSAASPDFDQALGRWQHIGTRAQDPDPLTIDGLYPVRFEFDGSSFTRTAANVTKDCSQAVYGSQLLSALESGHCSQVVRASYVSGKMMGTIGVVDLTSASAAEKAGHVTGSDQIIAPLAAAKGVTSKLGNGTGVVQAEVKGHYLILIWAEFTDLKSPSTSAAKQQLETFATNLVTGSANINLSTRMLTGKSPD
jgi:hypothetical protein